MNDRPERLEREDARTSDGLLFVRSLAAVFGRFPLWSTTWFVLWSMALLVALPLYGKLA